MNQLILGDNLEIMKSLESESVDLIDQSVQAVKVTELRLRKLHSHFVTIM